MLCTDLYGQVVWPRRYICCHLIGKFLGFHKLSIVKRSFVDNFKQCLFIVSATNVIEGISHSHGWHMVDISETDRSISNMWWFMMELAYVATTTCLRISIAIFLARIIVSRLRKPVLSFSPCQ